MLQIGNHVSAAKGFMAMGREITSLEGNVFAFFTRNPRGGRGKAWDPKDVENFLAYKAANNIGSLVAHAPYTLNPCSPKEDLREFAKHTMKEDLEKMEMLPGNFYNFHPGSHVSQGIETGILQISELLNQVLRPEQSTLVLLETMSGKGSEIGSHFEELAQIIKLTEHSHLLGICLDTCHVYSAGYDIVNSLDKVLEEFDEILGLHRLKAIHLNDSLTPFASKKDRHAKIGEGSLGLEAITNIINHPALSHLPFILETPNDAEGYKREISLLRKLAK